MCPIYLHPSKKHLAYVLYQNQEQPIFYSQKGIIKEILINSFKLLDKMFTLYSKVTAILLQLHQVQATTDNKQLTRMLQKLRTALKKHYQCEVAYFWVREQNNAEAQHYHMVIMLSGHKCQQSKLVDTLAKEAWLSIHPDNFSYRVKNRIYRVFRSDECRELNALRMRLSYMAKKEGKIGFAPSTNCYGYSHTKVRKSCA